MTELETREEGRAELLRDLFEHPGWDLVLDGIDREVMRRRDAFFRGTSPTKDDFVQASTEVHAVLTAFRSLVITLYTGTRIDIPERLRALLG
jgi:hypothetical protein